ncbi:tRNA (mnm(5)s(2)U34)-methyltransferase [Halorhodospira halophila]|uniref:Putative rRNA methylase n=1 Tax=Halorhodospira halophila (strain DSM 244 / SL1) TaxID=349124 RepID=A1WXM2_HALHL|nr:class I SAM-dependent methyltransferase [Halorhodospira halophila]ABM62434.1 putative rRNA methylase [Halorhodospira halophila SL1]MBK1729563.1 hypothetical protein [Halorhodospira halophila]
MSEPLTQTAHRHVARVLGRNGRAIDATAGNGHDARFLAEQTGPGGSVLVVDLQWGALHNTRTRLEAAGNLTPCYLVQANHRHLATLTPADWHGSVDTVTFNLGYLPGGDRAVTTQPEHTEAALDAARRLLRPGGLLSVVAYRGHPGGAAEARCVARWMTMAANAGDHWQERAAGPDTAPILHLLWRQGEGDHHEEGTRWRS